MARRSLWRPILAVVLAFMVVALRYGDSAASPAHTSGQARVLAVDSDGDGIPDDMDPDDNNNGILDGDEGVEGTSPPNDPLPDSDTDGITDDMDPDDNNNAVTDENEPAQPPPAGDSPGGGGNTSIPDTSSNPASPASSGSNSGQPIVSALPVTGAGAGAGAGAAGILPGWYTTVFMVVSAVLFAGCAHRHLGLRHFWTGT